MPIGPRVVVVVAVALGQALCVTVAYGDTVFLKPRGRVEGKVVGEEGDAYLVRLPSGGTTRILKSRVAKIEIDPDAPPVPPPPARKVEEPAPAPAPSADSTPSPSPAPAPAESPPDAGEVLLVPETARLGGSSKVEDAASASQEFRAGLESVLVTGAAPEALRSWIEQNGKREQDRAYVVRLMQTWKDEGQRLALWRAWVRLDKPERAEERLLPFAGSDIEQTRLDGCRILREHATWQRFTPLALKLLDLSHPPSQEAAHGVIESLVRREFISDSLARTLVQRFAKATDASVKDWYGRTLRTLACAEKGHAVMTPLESDYSAARDVNRKVELLPLLLCGLPSIEAHTRLVTILRDASTDPLLLRTAILELPRFRGAFADIPLLVPLLEVNAAERGSRAANPVHEAVITAVATIAHRPRFDSAAALLSWWEEAGAGFDEQATLIPLLAKGGEEAARAMRRLTPVYTDEVTAALRNAARSGADAGTRMLAAQTLVVRKDRRGVPAILEALRTAKGDNRVAIARALRTLAGSDEVPEDPEAASAWWRERFPEDLSDD